jgi:hypothetical protein
MRRSSLQIFIAIGEGAGGLAALDATRSEREADRPVEAVSLSACDRSAAPPGRGFEAHQAHAYFFSSYDYLGAQPLLNSPMRAQLLAC